MSQAQDIAVKMRKIRKLFLCFCCLFSFTIIGFAQTAEWIYIARSTEGKYYVKRKVDQLTGGNPSIWMKIVSDDGSEQISYIEWDCKNRRFRLNQTSTYAADGKTLNQQKNLEWALVTPESIAEDLFEEACGIPRRIKYALVILPKAQLRDSPAANAQVYRMAKRGERFPLGPFKPVGGWYHIYDPQTLAEYWLHGNTIKIVSEETDSKTNKPAMPAKRIKS